jgi:predicted nucleic acid-binding protein
VSRKWVVNASPLILLTKVSHIFLLHELCSELVIPSGVSKEILNGPANDPTRIWLNEKGTSSIRDLKQVDPVVAAWDLGLGESQVISWAYKNPRFEAILDDRAGRKCALSLKIPLRGTISVILLAKREGRLAKVEPLLNQLIQIGFRIGPELLRATLRLAKE